MMQPIMAIEELKNEQFYVLDNYTHCKELTDHCIFSSKENAESWLAEHCYDDKIKVKQGSYEKLSEKYFVDEVMLVVDSSLEDAKKLEETTLKECEGKCPKFVEAQIMYKDDLENYGAIISLSDAVPEGLDEDDIHYYTHGIKDLCSLMYADNGEDFFITEIYEIH